MKSRDNVRLLILNSAGHILLMRVDDHRLINADGSRPAPFWATLGGGLEAGEDIYAAAAREAREETGRSDIRIGKPVWYGEVVLNIDGAQILLRETYLTAWLEAGELSRAGWTALEQEVIKDVRWWSLDELKSTTEPVFPERISELLVPIVEGRYPDPPLVLKRD